MFTKALLYYQKLQLDDKAERKIAFAKRGLGLAQLINTFFLNTQDDHSKQIRDCKANFDDSLKLYTKLDDKWGIAEALAGQAMTSAIVDNNYHDALNLMSKSLQIRTDIRDYSGIGWAHFTIADYLQQLAQEENVIEHLEKAKEYFTLAGDRWGLANNGEFLGFCLMIEKRYDDAEAELSQSKMLHSMIGGINQADYAKLYSVMLLIERRDDEDIEEKLWKIINRAGAIGEEFIQIYGFGILLRYFQLEDQTLKVIATIDHFRTISAGMFTNQKNSFIGLAITYLLLAKNNYNQAVQFIAALSKRYPQMSHEKYNIASLEYKRLTTILKEKLGNNDFHDLTAIGESWSNQQFDDQLTETF
ncbi:MAG TPA: hypothetical protein P5123_12010 [Spirochaetota bacterium]|nr:hypothetical protein [Spirochaetota bacterium]